MYCLPVSFATQTTLVLEFTGKWYERKGEEAKSGNEVEEVSVRRMYGLGVLKKDEGLVCYEKDGDTERSTPRETT